MKSIKIDLPTTLKEIEIHTFSDLHIGDASCDINSIKERIKYVKETENAYIILNGDLMNNAIKSSVSDSYSERLTPMEQLKKCVELFKPVKNKILCITSGNHERRTSKEVGIDLMELLATELNLNDKFASIGAVLFVRFGWNKNRQRRQWYSIYITHGSGGGRREGSKANKLADMASIVDVDIYIHSHTHLPLIMKEGFYRTDFLNSSVAYVDKLFVNTSAALNYDGYGQIGEYKPSSKDCPVIYLDGKQKKFKATL